MSVCVRLSLALPTGAREIASIAAQHVNDGTPIGTNQQDSEADFLQPLRLLRLDELQAPRCVSSAALFFAAVLLASSKFQDTHPEARNVLNMSCVFVMSRLFDAKYRSPGLPAMCCFTDQKRTRRKSVL